MNLRNLEFFLCETATNIRRNALMSLAAASTVAISLMILGGTYLMVVNVGNLAENAVKMLEVHAYFQKSFPREKIDGVIREIEKLPSVEEVVFVPGEEKLAELGEQLQWSRATIASLSRRKVLPDAVTIALKDRNRLASVARSVEKMPGIEDVRYGRELAENVMRLNRILTWGGIGLLGLLGLGMMMIVHNTIRLTVFARRKEIRIMQLVGATDWFIRMPFLFEGAFYGLLGGLLSVWVLQIGYQHLADYLHHAAPFLPVVSYPHLASKFTGGIMFTGCFFSLTGSLLSLHRHLNEEE